MAPSPRSASTVDVDDISRAKAHDETERIENVLRPSPSHFEKLNLTPEQPVAGKLRLTFGNPAPIALGGFLLANTPATIDLMGWGGAGGGAGNASAGIGAYYFLGAILLYFGAIGEWILGNTFPAVVFFTFGGFWGTFGATLTPFFNVINGYANATTGKVDAAGEAAFYRSFAMFLIFMAVLCLLYTIAALRTNLCLVAILFCFTITFPCLAASYFYGADGLASMSSTTRIVGAAFAFVASMIGWYLWFSLILEAVDFPVVLPVGDLTKYVKGRSEKVKNEREMA
ncbi:GPR1 FUN34 -class plasma membrane [Lecanosticta acicola]|uniref:GPR1 FUN34 -class plasma membrane n=1 Tax=Lecanosticta acicola TaxID=111012 RepID=A0AAI8Z2H6_9PEZI|nr:GPR1 FUN34 -class plasma membrane [Lecanosticta acicola]